MNSKYRCKIVVRGTLFFWICCKCSFSFSNFCQEISRNVLFLSLNRDHKRLGLSPRLEQLESRYLERLVRNMRLMELRRVLNLSSLYVCMVNIKLKYNFVVTPRKFIIASFSCEIIFSWCERFLNSATDSVFLLDIVPKNGHGAVPQKYFRYYLTFFLVSPMIYVAY